MKRLLCMLSLLLVAMGAGAQAPGEGGALAPGIKYRFGISGKTAGFTTYLEASPEVGIGYRIDGRNLVGVSLQGECSFWRNKLNSDRRPHECPMWNAYLFHTHDFSSGGRSFYVEYKLGLADLMTRPLGWHAGGEAGWRITAGRGTAVRIGAVFDAGHLSYPERAEGIGTLTAHRGMEYSAGVVVRVEL